MSNALEIIFLKMVEAVGHPHRVAKATTNENVRRNLNGNPDAADCPFAEGSPRLLPGPVHPRIGGPFSGKIRWKVK